MSNRIPAFMAAVLLAAVALAQEGHVKPDQPYLIPAEDKDAVMSIGNEILCYCGCPRTTVASCDCSVADQIRRDIWSELKAGTSSETIIEAYLKEHGEVFRSMPKASGFGTLAWVVPYAGILLAAMIVLPLVVAWTRKRPGRPPNASTSDPSEPDQSKGAYDEQLEKELSELD